MVDLSNISDQFTLDNIKSSFDQYIVRPSADFGLGGFVWDIEGDSTISLNADITDSYVEDNSAIQDHIAIRPKRVILRNYVGELVNRLDPSSQTGLQKVVQKLTIIDGYLPQLSAAAAQAKSVYQSLINMGSFTSSGLTNLADSTSLSDLADLWGLVKNLTHPQTEQEKAYMYFKALHEQKILVSVQTPHEFMTNMAIETVIAYQDKVTKDISDFTISMKQIRFAKVKTAPFDQSKFDSRSSQQISDTSTGGKLQGTATTIDPSSTPPVQSSSLTPNQVLSQAGINVAPGDQQAISSAVQKVKLPVVGGIN